MVFSPVDPDHAHSIGFVLAQTTGPRSDGWHSHRVAPLVYAAEGGLTVMTPKGRWIVRPGRAVWVPSGMPHAVESRCAHRLVALYTDPSLVVHCDGDARVVAIDRLVRELLLAGAQFGAAYAPGGAEERLLRVILDRLPTLAIAPLSHLPEPTSPALRRITKALGANVADDRSLASWARRSGMSERTAARRFVAETGMSFGRWRQQLRLLTALERLAAGASVTEVAFEVGYEDVSSFIATFKAAMGTTPARYFAEIDATK